MRPENYFVDEHPRALTLSLFLVAEQAVHRDLADEGADIQSAIAQYMEDWPDEWKADLYARLAESINKTDTHAEIRRKCSDALDAAER